MKATAEPLPEPPPPRSPRRAPGPSPTAGAPCPLLQVPQFRRGAAGRAAGAGSRRSPHCWSIAVPALSSAHRHRALHAGTEHHTPAPSTAHRHRALHTGTEHQTLARSITPRHQALRTGTEHRTVTPSIACRPRALLHASTGASPVGTTGAPPLGTGTRASPRSIAHRHRRRASPAASIAPSAPVRWHRGVAHGERTRKSPAVAPSHGEMSPRPARGHGDRDPAAPRRGQCLRAGDPARGTRRRAGAGKGPNASRKVMARPRGHRHEATEGWPKATSTAPWGTPWTARTPHLHPHPARLPCRPPEHLHPPHTHPLQAAPGWPSKAGSCPPGRSVAPRGKG